MVGCNAPKLMYAPGKPDMFAAGVHMKLPAGVYVIEYHFENNNAEAFFSHHGIELWTKDADHVDSDKEIFTVIFEGAWGTALQPDGRVTKSFMMPQEPFNLLPTDGMTF